MRRVALASALLVAAVGCGSSSQNVSSPGPSSALVLAAASLTDAFRAVGAAFAKEHPDETVTFSFAGSQSLVAQIKEGAPGDVFASADERSMAAVSGSTTSPPQVFARNTLAIAVAPGNPKHISGLADLARSGITLVLAAPAVPAGNYARKALTAAGVTVHPKSEEENVRAVLTKVELGEADAGIVYTSDIAAAGDKVDRVAIPASVNQIAHYPIARISDEVVGHDFVAFVLSDRGQQILQRYGFLPAS